MTSVSSVSSSSYVRSSTLSQLDTNGDGIISEEELNASSSKSTKSQVEDTGDDAASAEQKFLGDLMAMLLSALQDSSNAGSNDKRPDHPDDKALFSKIDTDSDGNVTAAEFAAAQPDDVSEDQALELFKKLDTEGSGSLTEEQFVAGMKANRPDGPPPGMMSQLAEDDTETDGTGDIADKLEDILDQLKIALEAYKENYASASEDAAGEATARTMTV